MLFRDSSCSTCRLACDQLSSSGARPTVTTSSPLPPVTDKRSLTIRMTAVIRTHGLSKRYGHVFALRDLELEVAPGEVLGYLGPNGAGKTTTIRLLLGLIEPTSGSATMFDLDVQRSAPEI